jgi:hypothetical protein
MIPGYSAAPPRYPAGMKAFVFAGLLLAGLLLPAPAWTPAWAQSPVESYLAARDGYIGQLKQPARRDGEDAREREERALADLEPRLRQIIGPVELRGFLGPGKSNLDTLSADYLGFGMLDGLVFTARDDSARVLVTTEALLKAWLKAHRDWWPGLANVPQEIGAALRSEAFYTQAISPDAAVVHYAEIALPKAAGPAFAMLAARTQDSGPRTPDEIIVAVARGGRVYVASAMAAATVAPLPACERIWQDYEKMSEAAQTAYVASNLKDDKLSEQSNRLRAAGDAAYRRCFGERARKEGFFAEITRQARELAERVAGR